MADIGSPYPGCSFFLSISENEFFEGIK